MKVLTIKQPWATLIMQGDKRFEFRSWQTKCQYFSNWNFERQA